MSGVEAAGFVLAAFPLLISALEHYRETAEAFSDWWKFKREYRKCKDEICFHQLSYEQNLEKYLLPLIVDDDELDALIQEPGGERWNDPELELKLKARLPRAYELYLSTIVQMNDTIAELHDVLGTDKPYLQEEDLEDDSTLVEEKKRMRLRRMVTKQKIGYEAQRAKFSVGKPVRTKLFKEISDLNSRMKELLDVNDEINSLKASRIASRGLGLTTGLSKVWIHASNIFKVLSRAWRCDCSSLHRANLMLEHRTTNTDLQFHVLFQFARSLITPSCWKALRARIDLADTKSTLEHTSSEVTIARPNRPSMRSSLRKKEISPSNSVVLAESTQSLPPKAKVGWQDTPPLSRASSFIAPGGEAVEDLCNSIAICKHDTPCLGVMKSEEHSYVMCPIFKEKTQDDHREMATLASLLRKDRVAKFTRRQRFFIALALASSQYQLQHTPWLGQGWNKESILFLRESEDPLKIVLEQPFISRDFTTPESDGGKVPTGLDNNIPALGIMLLELCFDTAFEEHEVRKRFLAPGGVSSPYLDLAAALEWCNTEAAEEAGPEFAEAVKFCLSQFGSPALDDKRRQEFADKVIRPLQYCHQQFEIST
ncbi:hypothetical protein EJ08DRAFT_341613 [Tothia fuscella]|uniref:DUF7580 domain-containing protein n=1 Tax=Tothia fuscella TaxID=1048955 RepID=A0A9P4P1D8_9PEZI|nr:hypothetical protein EJ08DRAFT_341613 [Tothia fuscella]